MTFSRTHIGTLLIFGICQKKRQLEVSLAQERWSRLPGVKLPDGGKRAGQYFKPII